MAHLTRSSISAGFVLLLVLLATVEAGEDKHCKTASIKFRGMCFSSRNCESVCMTEGNKGGECEGFRRRCICNTPCF
ncbi:hypothetical protein GQ457_15G014570 [Hibiscus cannabinus]